MRQLENKEWLSKGTEPFIELSEEFDNYYFSVVMFQDDNEEYIAKSVDIVGNSCVWINNTSEPQLSVNEALEDLILAVKDELREEVK